MRQMLWVMERPRHRERVWPLLNTADSYSHAMDNDDHKFLHEG